MVSPPLLQYAPTIHRNDDDHNDGEDGENSRD